MSNEAWKKLVHRLIREGILRSPRVIRALHQVPRAGFVPERARSYATVDTPLPIGLRQTISAPLS